MPEDEPTTAAPADDGDNPRYRQMRLWPHLWGPTPEAQVLLNEQRLRILKLLLDYRWHHRDEICRAAGTSDKYAREGTRRLRELKKLDVGYDKRPAIAGNEYRLTVAPEWLEEIARSRMERPHAQG